jgi:hypothetical protein
MDWSGWRDGQVAGASECGNEILDSIKFGEILYQLKSC